MAGIENDGRQVTVSPITRDEKLSYMVANLQGVGARQRQEDSFAFVNALSPEQYLRDGLMFCVCDGMGGMSDGKVASETAVASLRRTFASLDKTGNIGRQLADGLIGASDEVFSQLGGGGGSTAVFCVIIDEKLYFASAGDSFLYLFREGRLIRLNSEHNLCHEKYLENIRDGYLDINEPRNDPETNALTSFLGMAGELTVDLSENAIPLLSGDLLLACSDGVGGVLCEKALKSMLVSTSVAQMTKDIEESIITMNRVNQDNYTALIVQCI